MSQQFTTTPGSTAYLLTAGEYDDRELLGVLVGVTEAQANAAANTETLHRTNRTGPYAHSQSSIAADMLKVSVESLPVLAPPPPANGDAVMGGETQWLPTGTFVAEADSSPVRTYMRTATGGWITGWAASGLDTFEPMELAPFVRYIVLHIPDVEDM